MPLPTPRRTAARLLPILAALIAPHDARAEGEIPVAELARTTPVDFAAEVAPILRANCLACHDRDDPEGDLDLESPQAMLRGGTGGPAIVPGASGKSRLLRVAAHRSKPIMPPRDNKVGALPLTPDQLGLIRLWIDQGAAGAPESRPAPVAWQAPAAGFHPILAVALSPDGKYAACSRADQIDVYHLPAARLVARLIDPGVPGPGAAHVDLVRSLAFSPRGDVLASGGFRTIKLWRRPRIDRESAFDLDEVASAVAVNPAGTLAAFGQPGGRIVTREWPSGTPVREVAPRKEGAPAPTGLAFAPDGSRLYSATPDGTIRAWSVADGANLGTLATPSPIRALAVVDQGGKLATGHDDGQLRVWDVATLTSGESKPLATIAAHSRPVTALATWAGAPGEVASASEDGWLRRWDLAGAKLREVHHGGPIAALAARPDGSRFAAAGPGNARLWDASNGTPLAEIKGDPRALAKVALAEGEIAFANGEVDVRKQEFRELEERVKTLTQTLDAAQKLVEPAEKALAEKREAAKKPLADKRAAEAAAKAAAEAVPRSYEVRKAAEMALARARDAVGPAREAAARAKEAAAREPGHADLANAAEAAGKASAEAVAGQQAAEMALKTAGEAVQAAQQVVQKTASAVYPARDKANAAENQLKEAEAAREAAGFTVKTTRNVLDRDQPLIPKARDAIAAAEGNVGQREASKQAAETAAKATERPWHAVAFSPDGAWLLAGGDDQAIHAFDAVRGLPSEVLDEGRGPVLGLAAGGAGEILALAAGTHATAYRPASAWALDRVIGRVDAPQILADRVLGLDFQPDGTRLASAGGEPGRPGELKLWGVADGGLIREFPGLHKDTIFGVRFAPSGDRLATASADRSVKITPTADGPPGQTLAGHAHYARGVAWRADGKFLASGGADNAIKIWDAADGSLLRTETGDVNRTRDYRREVTSVSFIGASDLLLAASGDRTVRVHHATSPHFTRVLEGSRSFVHAAAATPDGKLIVAGGHDGILRVWSGAGGNLVREFPPPEAGGRPPRN